MTTSSKSAAASITVTDILAVVGTVSLAVHLVRQLNAAHKKSSFKGTKVAVVLSGCGVYDGTEITEAVSILIHLSRAGVEVSAFAPDKEQMHVVNHLTGEADESSKRNVLEESARISRGSIKALDECSADDFDALIVPGGFGAAKNLSDFAIKGADLTVDATMEQLLLSFHEKGKPIGLCCISPTIAAKVFGHKGCKLTVGSEEKCEKWPFADAAGAIKSLGAQHIQTLKSHEVCIDMENKLVSSSAYMYAGLPHEIDESVGAMVAGVLSMI